MVNAFSFTRLFWLCKIPDVLSYYFAMRYRIFWEGLLFLDFAVCRVNGVRSNPPSVRPSLWAFYHTSPFHIALCMCHQIFFPGIFGCWGRLGARMLQLVRVEFHRVDISECLFFVAHVVSWPCSGFQFRRSRFKVIDVYQSMFDVYAWLLLVF